MNEKIDFIKGNAIPLIGDDIDTDRIIPARFMKCLTFDGLGQFAFYDVRFDDKGSEKEHVLNRDSFKGNPILISNRNFGCGSSREHAPWALKGMGIKCIIAQSYAEIFANNCSSLGIPALIVDESNCKKLQEMVIENPELDIEIDLNKKVLKVDENLLSVDMPETYRLALIDGKWDSTSMLMDNLESIKEKHLELPKHSPR